MKPLVLVTCSLLLLGGLPGCGHTTISTNDPRAAIFVDDQFLGRGSAEIGRMGFPTSTKVTVKRDNRIQHLEISRSFTLTTLFAGFFSAYTGWLWAWQYPETVTVDLPASSNPHCSGWDLECQSPWDRGVGWRNK